MKTFTEEYREFLTTHDFRTVNAAGQDFEVIDSGSGGQTIVFLNGVDMYQFWKDYVSALENNYRTVMIKYPLTVWKNTEMAALLHELFIKLGIDAPILVGISDGGVLAQLYAKLYRVSGLIMVSTLTVDSSYVESMKKEKFFMPIMKRYIKKTSFDKLRVRLVESVKKHFRNETEEEKAYAVSFLECVGSDEGYRYMFLRAIQATNDITRLEKFQKGDFSYLAGKVLVLIPENDMFDKSDSQKLVDVFTDPVVKRTYGGHLGLVMRSDLYIPEIKRFLHDNF